ncbi:MAG TPA: hypothetical protein VMV77_12715 [Bacteroidales bacterium]|nr:hypothetical protein [Bacteroidales bacterium]
MLERKIIIGLITSTPFIQQIYTAWDVQLLEAQMARLLAGWCIRYYEKYQEAPKKEIEGIYYQELKTGRHPQVVMEEIEQEILPKLSDEYENEKFNLGYLLDQTHEYFNERHLQNHTERITTLLEDGELLEAEKCACEYKPLITDSSTGLDLSSEVALDRVKKAFEETAKPVVRYPKQLGDFWNQQLVRGGFVVLTASDKRGKSFWLLDMAIRACRQKAKVVFFQAGDMTEDQQLKRICTYLTKKSNLKKYSGKMFQPVRDCIHNQRDDCDLEERECDFGVFEDKTEEQLRREITLNDLKKEYKDSPDYRPCSACEEYRYKPWGCSWIEEVDSGAPMTVKEAQAAVDEYFIQNNRRFKLSSHANGTLTLKEIKGLLDVWERQDGFSPDLIVIDYADLLVPEVRTEFRHQVDNIWKGLRNLSQERHCLVASATQADAAAYEKNRLKISNFSEDKRKNAHVTAMYGLNQDTKDREKRIGLTRINEIVIREGDFSNANEITVLQNLKRGQPFLGSYW